MKVLVTGGNGFLGSHVAERIAGRGVEVRLMVRRTSKLDYLDGVDYERVEGDLRSPESLERAVAGADAVAHLGGLTSALDDAGYYEVNALGTAHLAQAAAKARVKRFVYVSSIAAQGPNPDPLPIPPDPPQPISAYGRSKLAGEYPVLALRDEMSVAVLRPPVCYGQRDRALLPFYRMAKLGFVPVYEDGRRLLSWVHAHDAADATIAATLATEAPSGAIYTVSDGATHTWRSLVEAFAKVRGGSVRAIKTPPALFTAAGYAAGLLQSLTRRPLPLSPDEVRHMRARYWVCDNSLIARDLGWEPKVGIEEGFSQMLGWYRERGWL